MAQDDPRADPASVKSFPCSEDYTMKFGIHSLLFTETFIDKDLPLLERCKQMGFDAVEIIPFDPDNFPAKKGEAGRCGSWSDDQYWATACRSSTTPSRPMPTVRKRGSSSPSG